MLILSHRGHHSNNIPENTLEAFDRAVSLGVDGIETDIQMSADGLPILFHDRVAPDGREVSSLSQAELSMLAGYPVPTLASTLEHWPDILWNLEIKTPSALEATVTLVRQYRNSRHFLITSFWHPLIEEFSRRVEVDCGVLVAHRPLGFSSRPNWLPDHPRVNSIVWNYSTSDAALLEDASACRLRSFVYGASTPGDHQRLREWKPYGVITDHPEFLLNESK